MKDLLEIINNLLSDLGVDKLAKIDLALNLKDDLEIDSISYAELVVLLENKFSKNINAQGRAETLGDIVNRLEL